MKRLLPLHEMAKNFGLISQSFKAKRGRKSYFTPEGMVALAFLKMYSGLSAPKLMEEINGNIHYQLFCGIRINPLHPLTSYKIIDSIMLDLSRRLKIQEQQTTLAQAWVPYMKHLDTLYTDATCYESLMRYPSDVKLLWECIEKAYKVTCFISEQLGEHRLKTKYRDIEKANLAYMKQRKHKKNQTRHMIMRLLKLLGKILAEFRRQTRSHPEMELMSKRDANMIDVITKAYRQQKIPIKSPRFHVFAFRYIR